MVWFQYAGLSFSKKNFSRGSLVARPSLFGSTLCQDKHLAYMFFFFFLTQCSGEPGGTAAGQGWQQGDYSALLDQALALVPRAFWEPMQRPGKEAGLNRPL